MEGGKEGGGTVRGGWRGRVDGVVERRESVDVF